MEKVNLKEIQAPLKQKYRENPDEAVIILKAGGKIGEGVTCRIDTAKGMREAGLHPATGGTGMQLCSGDMLLEALAACAGVTINAVSESTGIKIEDASVFAEGELDFRGTLGVSREAPVGFRNIRLHFDIRSDADDEQILTLIKLTERYCVVYQSLVKGPEIVISHGVIR